MQELQTVSQELSTFEPGQTLGLESRDNLRDMSREFTGVIGGLLDDFKENKLIAALIPETDYMKANRKIGETPYSTLDAFSIRTPEGVTAPMVDYLRALDHAVDDLLTIRQRLLDPLKKWVGLALTNPGHAEKVWLDKNISYVDIQEHKESLREYYDDNVGDDISFASIHKVYPRGDDFRAAGVMMDDLSRESAKILGDDIPKVTEEISELVGRLMVANEDAELMEKTPKASIAKLSISLYHAGLEVEFLSVVLFQVRIAAEAYKESVKKINNKL